MTHAVLLIGHLATSNSQSHSPHGSLCNDVINVEFFESCLVSPCIVH